MYWGVTSVTYCVGCVDCDVGQQGQNRECVKGKEGVPGWPLRYDMEAGNVLETR